MTHGYSRRFWQKMKVSTFSFRGKQVIALLAAGAVLALQVHYRVSKNGTRAYVIIAAPYVALLMGYFLIQAWQAAKALDKELTLELEKAISQSSEIFAELILAWLMETVTTNARFTLEHVAKETGLPEPSALQGLTLLGNKYGAVRETLLSGAWEYSATGPAVRLKSRYRLTKHLGA